MFVVRACCALFIIAVLVACGSAPAAQAPSPAPTGAPAAAAADTSTAPTASAPATTAAKAADTGATYPLTIENCGRTLRFERAPERIVVSYQSTAELLVALGLSDKIVGVQYGKAQEPLPELAAEMNALPFLVEPGLGSAAKETLIATRPDFVLVTYFSYDLDPSTGAASEADYQAMGAQVYGMAADAPCLTGDQQLSLATIYADIRTLGAIFGVPDRAAALIEEMQGRITAVHERVASREPLKAIYYEDGTGPFTVYGEGLATELLALAGGRNVLADQPAYTQVGQEVLADSGADVWVITEYPGFEPVEQRAAFLYETFPNLPAAQHTRSVGINGAEAGVGIRLPGVIETLARAFHPEAFAGSSEAGATYPVTIENCGVTTTYAKAPERVVALYPPATEMLLRLGLKDRIVGIAASGDQPLPADLLDDYRSLPSLAEGSQISREVLLSAQPDFVFDNQPDYFYDAAQGFATQDELRAAGASVYSITAKCGGSKPDASIEDVYTDLRNLGAIFGVSERAEELIAAMQQRLAAVQNTIAGQPPLKVIYYDAGEGPLGIFAKGAWEYVLTLAGGQNVFADVQEGYAQLSVEQVAARDTDVFIVAGYSVEGIKSSEERAAYLKATFPNTKAVQNDRVIIIPYEYTNPGLQNVDGVEALARALYPALFP